MKYKETAQWSKTSKKEKKKDPLFILEASPPPKLITFYLTEQYRVLLDLNMIFMANPWNPWVIILRNLKFFWMEKKDLLKVSLREK